MNASTDDTKNKAEESEADAKAGALAEANARRIKYLGVALIGGVILAVLIYAAFILIFTWPVVEFSVDKTGVFGDSFGLLTSLFSGLAFAGLIITIVMQRDELALQREELKLTRETLKGQKEELRRQNETLQIQQFESTFFKMLEFFDSMRDDISYRNSKGPVEVKRGREAIWGLYKHFSEDYLHNTARYQDGSISESEFKEAAKSIGGIKELYSQFYEGKGGELDSYYRTLFNLLKLIESNIFIVNKKVYTNLVRAQLSRYELSMLFYNCLSNYADKKMAPLVKKYFLLKHLEVNTLSFDHHKFWENFKRDSVHLSVIE